MPHGTLTFESVGGTWCTVVNRRFQQPSDWRSIAGFARRYGTVNTARTSEGYVIRVVYRFWTGEQVHHASLSQLRSDITHYLTTPQSPGITPRSKLG